MKTKINRRFISAVLAIACLVTVLFSVVPSKSGVGDYDIWLDTNNDGKIDMKDVGGVARAFGASGKNMSKATIEYDSGWVNITDQQGQFIDVRHGLNITDWNDENMDISIMGRTTPDGGILRDLGLADSVQGWNMTYGGNTTDITRVLIQAGDGGYVLGGSTWSYGAGENDAWLLKTDENGTQAWSKTFGGAVYEDVVDFVQTADGGYALACFTSSYGFGGNFWLVKTDVAGNAQWNRTIGGNGTDSPCGLVQTADGGYVLGGSTTSYGAGNSDVWLVKTDKAGNVQWNKTYGGISLDEAYAMVQTDDGGYALAGRTGSYGAGALDFWLVKTDSAGNALWNRTCGGTGDECVLDLIQTSGGGYALAGYTDSYGVGDDDWWLVKTGPLGHTLWNRTYGGTNMDVAQGLLETADGGYAVAGLTWSFGAGGSDSWFIKTDAAGNHQWNKTYGGTDNDALYDLVQTSDGGYALTGSTVSYGDSAFDGWLIKTDAAGNAQLGFKYGFDWVGSTSDTIELYRGTDDIYWNYVRVRIWKHKTP